MKASSYTPDQIIFLKKMNHLLRKKESELYKRANQIRELYQNMSSKKNAGSNKVEIDIVFEYSLSGTFIKFWEFPAAQHWIMNDGSVFISPNEDWWQKGFPDFGEKWCFAMSLLYDFKKLRAELFKISEFNFQIQIRENDLSRWSKNGIKWI